MVCLSPGGACSRRGEQDRRGVLISDPAIRTPIRGPPRVAGTRLRRTAARRALPDTATDAADDPWTVTRAMIATVQFG